jgi:DNA polymerase-1
MEKEGIRLDVPFLKSLSQELDKDIKTWKLLFLRLQAKIQFSSKTIRNILFEKLKLGGPKQRKRRRSICNRRRNSKLFSKDSEIVSAILDWRSLIKLQNTYVEALPLQVDAVTKRIHTDYMQTVAATGRLSSTIRFAKHPYSYRTGTKSEKHLLRAMKIIL